MARWRRFCLGLLNALRPWRAESDLDRELTSHLGLLEEKFLNQIPPRHKYLISRNSSSPYFDPSRPMPDSLTPPNGATSVEMMPVLIPMMPYSSASATRQMRPTSRP